MAATVRAVVCFAAGSQSLCSTSSTLRVESSSSVSVSFRGKGRLAKLCNKGEQKPAVILKRRNVYELRALSTDGGDFGTRVDEQPKTLDYCVFFADKTGKTGTLTAIQDRFRNYKIPDGKPVDKFGRGNKAADKKYFLKVIEETYGTWANLVKRSRMDSSSVKRREVLGKGIALLMSAISLPALATEPDLTLYQDKEDKYSLLVPQEWSKGEGTASLRKVTAFYPKNANSANVNIVITGLGADYTALGSFGTVDAFAENLVNSLDRAWQKPKGQAAKLIDSRSKNGMYYVEYTIQKPGEAKRHLLSVVGIASNGWINRLYTVTGQYWEDDGDKYRSSLQKVAHLSGFLLDAGVSDSTHRKSC